jgi:hypothetical protein
VHKINLSLRINFLMTLESQSQVHPDSLLPCNEGAVQRPVLLRLDGQGCLLEHCCGYLGCCLPLPQPHQHPLSPYGVGSQSLQFTELSVSPTILILRLCVSFHTGMWLGKSRGLRLFAGPISMLHAHFWMNGALLQNGNAFQLLWNYNAQLEAIKCFEEHHPSYLWQEAPPAFFSPFDFEIKKKKKSVQGTWSGKPIKPHLEFHFISVNRKVKAWLL